jgi:hypothetical protein
MRAPTRGDDDMARDTQQHQVRQQVEAPATPRAAEPARTAEATQRAARIAELAERVRLDVEAERGRRQRIAEARKTLEDMEQADRNETERARKNEAELLACARG